MDVRCSACGESNPARARFCLACGTPIVPAADDAKARFEDSHDDFMKDIEKLITETVGDFYKGLSLSLAAMLSSPAFAQAYPTKPIRLVVAFTAGGTTDFVARLLAEKLRGPLGQSVIVENKPGANGVIAAGFLKSQPADGYHVIAGLNSCRPNAFI